MGYKTDIARLAQRDDPFLVARAAIEVEYRSIEKDAGAQLDAGAPFDSLLDQQYITPLMRHAETVLTTCVAPDNVMSPYALKTLLATPRQHVFARLIFGQHATEQHRRRLHGEGYRIYGKLLEQALAEKNSTDYGLKRATLAGHIGELIVLSLLNKTDTERGGATSASVVADQYYGTNVRYRYMGDTGELRATSMHVKTRSRTWVSSNTKADAIPGMVNINLSEIFGDAAKRYDLARLIIADASGQGIDRSSQESLEANSRILKTHIEPAAIRQ